jgi:hypothetical protein
MPVKRGQVKSANQTLRKTRVAWPRLNCLKSNPDRGIRNPIVTLTQSDVTMCRRLFPCRTPRTRERQVCMVRYRGMTSGVGMSGRPKPR